MHFIPMDLTSMQSIRNAVKVLLEMKIPLHVLINNAGVMMNERMETVDGLEMTMAANVSNIIMKELKQQRLNF
jgi:short-subunit dehydrogenase